MKKLKWIHRWFSLVLGLFLILWAVSGIVLNHRGLFSGMEVKRSLLSENYHYTNWNNASVRSGLQLGGDSLLIYGNVGIYLTDTNFLDYVPFNEGLKRGIDNRRIYKLYRSAAGNLYAGTQSGLYYYHPHAAQWQKILLPLHDERIPDITQRGDKLVVMSRSALWITDDSPGQWEFSRFELPRALDDDGRVSLFKTLWVIHSGELLGLPGQLLVDLLALVLMFLVVTGFLYFFFPRWLRKRKKKKLASPGLVKTIRFSVKWHNKIGIWIGGFLLVTTLTGMFLRPPLLIAIATAKVAKIPFTMLDGPNPWHDKLRAIHWNEAGAYWLIGSNEGLYKAREDFSGLLMPFRNQPPLSVMGINVLEYLGQDTYLVGSFNGLFLWQAQSGYLRDYLTGEIPKQVSHAGSPIGKFMIAGMINLPGKPLVFDYDKGLMGPHEIPMPLQISQTPMPLWNFALEVHTARIFQSLTGSLYILIIPLFGLATLLILISGIIVWLKPYLRKRSRTKHK
jgi:hypothetical protein